MQYLVIIAVVACFNGWRVSTAVIALVIYIILNMIILYMRDK